MNENFGPLMIELKNPEKEIRLNALKKVYKLGSYASCLIDLVKENLTDYDDHVRSEAILALYSITGSSMICFEEVIVGLKSEDSDFVREAFSFVLSEKIKKNCDLPVMDSYIKSLVDLANSLDVYSKKQFCYAFGYIKKTAEIIDFLVQCAKSPIIDLKIVAIEAISKLENNYDLLLGQIIEEELDEAVKLKILNYNKEENENESRTVSRRACQRSL